MDLVLNAADSLMFDATYASLAPVLSSLAQKSGFTILESISAVNWLDREALPRQIISLFALTCKFYSTRSAENSKSWGKKLLRSRRCRNDFEWIRM